MHQAAAYPRFRIGCFVGFAGLAAIACQPSQSEPESVTQRQALWNPDGAAQGRFTTRIADLLDGTAKVSHHLVQGADELEIVLPPGVDVERGAVVRAEGDVANGVMTVDAFEVVAGPPTPNIDPTSYAPRRIGTILVFWENPGLPNSEALSGMFLSERSTNVFYQENSYGKEKIAGQVFGPYQIPDPGACNPSVIATRCA